LHKKITRFIRKNWVWIVLVIILLSSFWVRLSTTHTKWLLAYDPYYQYRHTKSIVEHGVLPKWDEYSYYPPGRPMVEAPFMYYLTGYLYILLRPLLGMTLMAFCKYMAAVYGAAGVVPAYLLGKEILDKKSGILASFFVGFSPAILTRSMGGFYDTDGLVIFFSLLTTYLIVRSLKKKSYLNYGLAILGLVLFGLTWTAAWYIPLIILLSTVVYFIILLLIGKPEWKVKGKIKDVMVPLNERLKKSLIELKDVLIPVIIIFVSASVVIWLLGYDALGRILSLLVFAEDPSKILIVNISVAELQALNVFGGAWNELFSRVGIPFILTIPGALLLLRRDRKNGAILLTWAGLSFYAITRGIRFMLVFAPAASISSAIAISEYYNELKHMGSYAPLITFGFLGSILVSLVSPAAGLVLNILMALTVLFINRTDEVPEISKPVLLATILIIFVITISQGVQAASIRSMAEPVNKNWEDAFMFLKNDTAKDAVVGTWWDPGHRITGIAERRAIADGAHCTDEYCKPGLNTRITDLGKIFVTDNETEAKDILLKYRGNASEMYWIVSDDLIGKFRWLQYFGTGCDGTGILTPNGQEKCPLYSQIPEKSYGYDQNYTIKIYYYQGDVSLVEQNGKWIAVMKRDNQNYLFNKEIYYVNDTPKVLDLSQMNNTVPGVIWVHPNKSYLVYIPPNLEHALFTRMFFYEENQTLNDFELVYRNDQVKIYKLKI